MRQYTAGRSRVAVANAELRSRSSGGSTSEAASAFRRSTDSSSTTLVWRGASFRRPTLDARRMATTPNINRYPLTSWGAGLRVNLFNLAILRWDYARPLSTDRKPNWTFSLGASY